MCDSGSVLNCHGSQRLATSPNPQLDKRISSIRNTFVTKSMDCHTLFYAHANKKSAAVAHERTDKIRIRTSDKRLRGLVGSVR